MTRDSGTRLHAQTGAGSADRESTTSAPTALAPAPVAGLTGGATTDEYASTGAPLSVLRRYGGHAATPIRRNPEGGDADDGGWKTQGGKAKASKADKIVEAAEGGSGMFSLGTATEAQAKQAGLAWVGEGYHETSSKLGTIYISADGTRQWRAPTMKPKLGKKQSNFESRAGSSGAWTNNGHLTIN
ncbi:hypothetical protein [Cellulomonas composti]|uniref:Uncharacterized protein n=1 Tax=Cellulomonas composti TaxID=266130 RepID=A0A511JEG6_9CELL|nr:hypothetical protein [Cellulomonas composti]GEL96381.1 hypothetical protein CCO02nite_30390 [Cellulomonas composti]